MPADSCATRCSRFRSSTRLRVGWSTAAACQRRPRIAESALSTPDRDSFDLRADARRSRRRCAGDRFEDEAASLLDQLGGRFDLLVFDDHGE